jgi:1-deoxy-D-xylulose-5-phosphate reductoisomerase
MGKKITVDSATMMNKGLEIIEAHWLFHVDWDKIEVLVHPQSIVHSMVEYEDGSVMAQLGCPDMKIPIGLALSYPHRLPMEEQGLDFLRDAHSLSFEKADEEAFPCMALAKETVSYKGKFLLWIFPIS